MLKFVKFLWFDSIFGCNFDFFRQNNQIKREIKKKEKKIQKNNFTNLSKKKFKDKTTQKIKHFTCWDGLEGMIKIDK